MSTAISANLLSFPIADGRYPEKTAETLKQTGILTARSLFTNKVLSAVAARFLVAFISEWR
jgi:hypothetical protein